MTSDVVTISSSITAANIVTKGYLFDIYHIKDKIILWIKELDKKVKRLEYSWSPSIYVASDSKTELTSLLISDINNGNISSFIKEYRSLA